MADLRKAKDFYLRGFRSIYIKRRTGVAIRELKKQFPNIDKPTIMKYQINYLSSRYSADEIATALEEALSASNALRQVKTGTMQVLGCSFGAFDHVFATLLGNERFLAIKKRCEQIRESVPEISGREARRQTMIARYGSEGPNGNPEIAARMMETLRATNQKRYGVDYIMQDPKKAAIGSQNRQATMLAKYGAPNSVQIPEIREKISEARKQNDTLTSSIHEQTLFQLLVDRFGLDDVVRNYKDERYPFYVDFYIRSRDLFIELNADRSHNDHWFDPQSEKDQERVAWMLKRAAEIDAKNKPSSKAHKSRYWNCVHVWIVLDVKKRETAQAGNLNYLVFWDAATRFINDVQQPRLKDAHEWFDAGCPDSKDWKKENTW